jgi:hypothetical protein
MSNTIKLLPPQIETNQQSDEFQITLVNSVNKKQTVGGLAYTSKASTYLFTFECEDFYNNTGVRNNSGVVSSLDIVLTASYKNHWIYNKQIYIETENGDVFQVVKNGNFHRPIRHTYEATNTIYGSYRTNTVINNITYPSNVIQNQGKSFCINFKPDITNTIWNFYIYPISADGIIGNKIGDIPLDAGNQTSINAGSEMYFDIVGNVQVGAYEYVIIKVLRDKVNNYFGYYFLKRDGTTWYNILPSSIDADLRSVGIPAGSHEGIFYYFTEDETYTYLYFYTINKDICIQTTKSTGAMTKQVWTTGKLFADTGYNDIYETDGHLILHNITNNYWKKIAEKTIGLNHGWENLISYTTNSEAIFYYHSKVLYYSSLFGSEQLIQMSPTDAKTRIIDLFTGAPVLKNEISYIDGDEIMYAQENKTGIFLIFLMKAALVNMYQRNFTLAQRNKYIKATQDDTLEIAQSNIFVPQFEINVNWELIQTGVYIADWTDFTTENIHSQKDIISLIQKRGDNIFYVFEKDKNILIYTNAFQEIISNYFAFEGDIITLENTKEFLLIVLSDGTKYALWGYDSQTLTMQKVYEAVDGDILCERNYIEFYKDNLFFVIRGLIKNIELLINETPTSAIRNEDYIIFKTSANLWILDIFNKSLCRVDHASITNIDDLFLTSSTNRFVISETGANSFEIIISNKGRPATLFEVSTVDSLTSIVANSTTYNAFSQLDKQRVRCNVQVNDTTPVKINFTDKLNNAVEVHLL